MNLDNFNKELKIFVADSCAGGIAVLKHVMNSSPNSKFSFLADGEKNPFGVKSNDEINEIVEDWLKYASKNKYDMLIIACNTASVAVSERIQELSNKYKIKIITMLDALKNALITNKDKVEKKNIVLFGTKFTVGSKIYSQILNENRPAEIYLMQGTDSERLVARGLFDDETQIKKVNLEINQFVDKNINTFILACTCFEFLKEIINANYKNVEFINPNETLFDVKKIEVNNKVNLKEVEFLTTGEIDDWQKNINIITNKICGQSVDVLKIKIR